AAPDHLRLFDITGENLDDGADAIAIGLRSEQLNADAVIACTLIAIQIGATAIGGHQHVKRAIIVYVGISRATTDAWCSETCAKRLRDLNKLAATQIAKHVRRLVIADSLLHFFDLVFDVAIRDQNVRPAIVVVIKKETTEAECDQSCAADFRARGLINEKSVALVVIQRKHLVGEITDDQAGAARVVVVARINSHAGARNSVFAERYASRNCFLLKRSIMLVEVELVGLGIVGQENIGPAVAVIIKDCET